MQLTVNPAVIPGLLLLILELLALAAVGFVVARVGLRQRNDLIALAQGMVIGLALWGLALNFVLRIFPGLAGTLLTWLVVLATGAWMARRATVDLRVPLRTLAGFATAALGLYWTALASRQLLMNPDSIHLALAASIQAGNWPPTLPWNPDHAVPYHYAAALLMGKLAPPVGPDLPFTSELLGAYAWTAFALIVGTTLARRGGWTIALVLTPLLLTAGAWGLVIYTDVPSILTVAVPSGIPEAGLRASLAAVYLPTVSVPWMAEIEASPANIWRPSFVLAYALIFVAFEGVVATQRQGWPAKLSAAILVGFTGLLDEAVALVGLALWMALEACRVIRVRPAGREAAKLALRAGSGPAAAALLLAAGGGVISGVLTGSSGGGLSLGWVADTSGRTLVGTSAALAGGVGILGLGPVVVAGVAAVLGRRDPLTLTLAGATAAFLLAAVSLQYEFAEHDVVRMDGHARNFALLAVLVAMASRLAALRVRWRLSTAVLVAVVVTWPTVAAPAGGIGAALGNGVQIGNANAWATADGGGGWELAGRQRLVPFGSEEVTAWIRHNTAADARVLSPHPHAMTANTGRLNASGFTRFAHLFPKTGPAYEDAIGHLEPAALRRLGITHVHAPDAWAAELPARAGAWLGNPDYFALVARGEADALYVVQPAFRTLNPEPTPESYEALRQAIPEGRTVYLARDSDPLTAIQVAAALPQARLLGSVRTEILHPLTRIAARPLGDELPDFLVTSMELSRAVAGRDWIDPFWWNDKVLIFARDDSIEALLPAPRAPGLEVGISAVRESEQSVEFTATVTNRTDERWTGQDWLVIKREASPLEVVRNLRTGPFAQWFDGQIEPKPGSTSFGYRFSANPGELAVRTAGGTLAEAPSSGRRLEPGEWMLAMRLHDSNRKAHFFPLLAFEIRPDGSVRYETVLEFRARSGT